MANIIIVVDTYSPDTTSGSKLIVDLTKELKKNNKLLLICPRDKTLNNTYKKNIIVHNIYCGPIKSKNFYIRGFFEFFMSVIIWFNVKNDIKKFKPDIFICYSPSIFFNYLCKKISKVAECKKYLILRDIFPFWVFDTGKMKNFIIRKILVNYFKDFCSKFNKIGVEAKTNINFLKKIGLKNKIEHLPNWIDTKNFQKKKKFSKKKYNFIFFGNIGHGQGIKKINNFIRVIKNNKYIKFYICGDGANKHKLNIDKNSSNLKIENSVSYNKLLTKMEKINFGIISLREEINTVNFPGKLLTYLLTNTPILILSKKRNELTNFIERKNIGVRMSSTKNFHDTIKKLVKVEKRLHKDKKYFKRILETNFSVLNVKNKILSLNENVN